MKFVRRRGDRRKERTERSCANLVPGKKWRSIRLSLFKQHHSHGKA